jgi:hypothetical protein
VRYDRGVHAATRFVGLTCLGAIVACSSQPEPLTLTPRDGGTSASSGTASFSKDVMPIIGESCALTACHAAKQSNLGIHLTFDEAQVYAELEKASPTFAGVKFVVPGKPDESLVMAKMDGTQAKVAACNGGCGREMPPEDLLPQEKRDVLRRWIANGAKRD